MLNPGMTERNRQPIRDVFDAFVTNCKNVYPPFHYVTVDDKFKAFRERCSFRQYTRCPRAPWT